MRTIALVGPEKVLSDYMDTDDLKWLEEAECSGIQPPAIFFELKNSTYVRVAKTICGMCTVQEQCLEYAMQINVEDGIWGGLLPKERRRYRREWLRR